MASVFTGAPSERPSYSKVSAPSLLTAALSVQRHNSLTSFQIAASGLKPAMSQHTTDQGVSQQPSTSIMAPHDGASSVAPSNVFVAQAYTPKQKKLVALSPKEPIEVREEATQGPRVRVYSADSTALPGVTCRALDGMLMPSAVDESGTQMSGSSGSGKPASLDGKSVTSGTTFALDEKESLRPDDSASVKATDEEEAFFSPAATALPDADSDDVARAFRDQLREIQFMDVSKQSDRPPVLGHDVHVRHAMLYIPPEGSGIGVVPGQVRLPRMHPASVELPPDSKLLEALDSPKDRIMVLKLEQDLADFVKDAKEPSLTLPQLNAFHRMLAHKLADYYMLGHHSDEGTSAVRIYKTSNCRLPPPLTGIATPSTAASTPPPMPPPMKILRRGGDHPTIANGSNAASENGESGGDDRKAKQIASREQREAKYEEVRKRIMGSAKPAQSPEQASQKDDSRSSSAAGKKGGRRKQRSDSDDDFEARSAYSAVYPQPYAPAGLTATYGYGATLETQHATYSSAPQGGQVAAPAFSPYGTMTNVTSWNGTVYNNQQAPPSWMYGQTQNQQPGFDLSSTFNRVLNLQPTSGPMSPNAGVPNGYPAPFSQQYNHQQPQWSQIQYPGAQPSNVRQEYQTSYPAQMQQQAMGQYSDGQQYAYGQLPSQAFPGRPPNKLEHPLPGSYKSKHFNPQSQAFVPGHTNGIASQTFVTQGTMHGGDAASGGYSASFAPPHRSQQAYLSNMSVGSAHIPPTSNSTQRTTSQPMMHPLPQPVFPRQPSPNVPLPPKPEHGILASASASVNQQQSTIAKWGAPSSLPAKPPPPSLDSFDPNKLVQAQRQASYGSGRGAMPSFGTMAPAASAYGASR